MEIQTIINDALKEPNELDNIKLAKISGFNDKEIEMVKLFWEPAFNKSWLYLSSEIIHDHLGYKESKQSSADFYKKMRTLYIENIDYKEVAKDHDIIKYYENFLVRNISYQDKHGGSNKKYYIITGETFKKMCMRANTTKGNETCDYFIKVESLVIIMTKYLMERIKLEQQRQLQEKEQLLLESKEAYERQQQELEEAKQKNLNLRTIIKNTQMHDYDGYLYFVTNKQYSLENHYLSFFN